MTRITHAALFWSNARAIHGVGATPETALADGMANTGEEASEFIVLPVSNRLGDLLASGQMPEGLRHADGIVDLVNTTRVNGSVALQALLNGKLVRRARWSDEYLYMKRGSISPFTLLCGAYDPDHYDVIDKAMHKDPAIIYVGAGNEEEEWDELKARDLLANDWLIID